jgi:hypothetical protein
MCNAQQQDTTKCPPEGKTNSGTIRYVNWLRNRDITPAKVDSTIALDTLLKGGPDDTARFSPNKYVTITGWVVEAEDEGPESCNCFSKDSSQWGIQIYLATSLDAWKDSIMVVELTPKYRAIHHFTSEGLFEEKIRVTGYLMFNYEAKKFSLNACKKCHTTDRKTAWEVAPVTDLVLLPKPEKPTKPGKGDKGKKGQ